MFVDTILGMGRTSIMESTVDPEIEAISPDTVEECAGDPFEFLTAAYYESEMNMTNINQAVMVCEYTYLKETGTEMVYESNVVTTMFKKVGEGIKRAWKKICEFFKGIFSWLENIVRSDKKFVEKYSAKIKNIDSVKLSSDIKGYTYGSNAKAFSKVDARATLMLNQIKKKADEVGGAASATDLNVEETLNALRGKLVGEDSVTAADFNEKLVKKFRGDEATWSTISNKELTDMLEVVATSKKTKADLNALYKSTKASIDALLKAAKANEKKCTIKDDGSKDKDNETAKGWHISATILNSLTSITTQVNNKAAKAITAHNRQCKAIVTKAVAASQKDNDEAKNESASFVDSVFESILG